MQLILDHMIAAIVAGVLTIALMSQQIRNRQASVERISVYSAKAQSLVFGEWFEDDIAKLGTRFGRERGRFSMTTRIEDGVKYTDEFTLHYNASSSGAGVVRRVEIRYMLEEDTTADLVIEEGDTPADEVRLTAYRLRRDSLSGRYDTITDTWLEPGGRPDWTETPGYRAPAGLRHFQVQPMDSDGQPLDDSEPGHETDYAVEADYARLQFTVVPTLFPLHRARLVPKEGLHWATTIELRPY